MLSLLWNPVLSLIGFFQFHLQHVNSKFALKCLPPEIPILRFASIDDIEDRSVLRRGIPVAHKVFGTASCINSANFIYFLGLEKCLKLQKPEAISIFTGRNSFISTYLE